MPLVLIESLAALELSPETPVLACRETNMKLDLVVVWPVVLCTLSLVAGLACLAVNAHSLGWFVRYCKRRRLSEEALALAHCGPPLGVIQVAAISVAVTLIIVVSKTGLPAHVPWCVALLMVAAAPPLLAWFGPPAVHMEREHQRHIGVYNAWSHYYGYLQLFRDKYAIRFRLDKHATAEPEVCKDLYRQAAVILWPLDGCYPNSEGGEVRYDRLHGVGAMKSSVPGFKTTVGSNERKYPKLPIHEVSSSDGGQQILVALDKVQALCTLKQMGGHGVAGLSSEDCAQQMKEMLGTMRHIVAERSELKDQLLLITYRPGVDHVGDQILQAISPVRNGREEE